MAEKGKSHLAEVLGVDDDEVFEAMSAVCRVHNGIREILRSGKWERGDNERFLTAVINNPRFIEHRYAPVLSEPEIAIMKAVGAIWVSRDTDDNGDDGIVELWDEKPNYNNTFFFGNGDSVVLGRIAGSLFPHVHPGECICVEDQKIFEGGI